MPKAPVDDEPLSPELERDAITELVNIAVSGAAVRLRQMVGAEVILSVPATSLVEGGQAVQMMQRLGLSSFVAVRQTFEGALSGETMLVFPEGDQEDLIRAILGAELDAEFEELKDDALAEVGNVLLVGFLSTIGNTLRLDFDVSTPLIVPGRPSEVFTSHPPQMVLFIYVNFTVRGLTVQGFFALVLGLASYEHLRLVVARFVEQLGDH